MQMFIIQLIIIILCFWTSRCALFPVVVSLFSSFILSVKTTFCGWLRTTLIPSSHQPPCLSLPKDFYPTAYLQSTLCCGFLIERQPRHPFAYRLTIKYSKILNNRENVSIKIHNQGFLKELYL